MERVLECSDGSDNINIMKCSLTGDVLRLQLASDGCVETLKTLVRGIHPMGRWRTETGEEERPPETNKASFFLKGWG